MELKTYIIRSAAGTRIGGFASPEQASRSLLPGEVAAIATPADLAEHNERIAGIIAAAKALRVEEPDPLEVVAEILKAKGLAVTPAEIEAATVKARSARQARLMAP